MHHHQLSIYCCTILYRVHLPKNWIRNSGIIDDVCIVRYKSQKALWFLSDQNWKLNFEFWMNEVIFHKFRKSFQELYKNVSDLNSFIRQKIFWVLYFYRSSAKKVLLLRSYRSSLTSLNICDNLHMPKIQMNWQDSGSLLTTEKASTTSYRILKGRKWTNPNVSWVSIRFVWACFTASSACTTNQEACQKCLFRGFGAGVYWKHQLSGSFMYWEKEQIFVKRLDNFARI